MEARRRSPAFTVRHSLHVVMAAADESLLATAEEHPAAPSQSAAPSPAATKTPARDVGASGAAERKLFVGGLSYSTTTNGLHSFFARFGRIHEVRLLSWCL